MFNMKINDNGVDRDMTDNEIEAHKLAANELIADIEKQNAEKTVKEQTRAAALAKLGLTADEIAALFG